MLEQVCSLGTEVRCLGLARVAEVRPGGTTLVSSGSSTSHFVVRERETDPGEQVGPREDSALGFHCSIFTGSPEMFTHRFLVSMTGHTL